MFRTNGTNDTIFYKVRDRRCKLYRFIKTKKITFEVLIYNLHAVLFLFPDFKIPSGPRDFNSSCGWGEYVNFTWLSPIFVMFTRRTIFESSGTLKSFVYHCRNYPTKLNLKHSLK